ncbi:MAG: hypothetical protein ACE148_06400 [Vicinamibacterales bacterium]
MINYTACITDLMQDIVRRLPELGFIDLERVLVFARYGRSEAEGAYATCHSLNLPTSEPGYYYWRDRRTGEITRRSEWFVTKSPVVSIRGVALDYLISFTLPRFTHQSLEHSRKEIYYPGGEPWLAKLDTIVHELYHIDPERPGIRRIDRSDGGCSGVSHSVSFYEEVSRLVKRYLAASPDPERYNFLRYTFEELTLIYGGVVATTFNTFPSYPQRYREAITGSGEEPVPDVTVEPVKQPARPRRYTEADLELRQFFEHALRGTVRREVVAPGWAPRQRLVTLAGARQPSTAANRRRR